ncbi:cellulose binding domain-containing protein [Nonomuraea dietziae]|uniref:cellulose binding domain-containing protein n=1 Tax=Nonomuraea dietziae TaxID=65515 RepID=UPI0031DDBDD0
MKILLALALPFAVVAALLAAPANAAQGLRLQYKNSSTTPTTAQAEPWFQLLNDGASAVPLAQVKIRYYLTGTETYRFACSWAVVGCSTVTGTFGNGYLEVGFTSGTLAPGGNTRDLQLRFHRADWQSFDQSDDYSFGVQTGYADWEKAAVYVNGQLAWGRPPGGGEPTPTPTPTDPPTGSAGVLFDDFSYTGSGDPRLAQRGWTVRSSSGGPGVPGATWSPAAVTFPGGVLQLESSTDGTGAGTVQTELSTANRKFFEGTYAAPRALQRRPRDGARRRARRADLLHHHAAAPEHGPRLRRARLRVPAERRMGRARQHPLRHQLGDLPGRPVAGGQHPHRGEDQLLRLARPGRPGVGRARQVLRRRAPVRRPWRRLLPRDPDVDHVQPVVHRPAGRIHQARLPAAGRLGLPHQERGRLARRRAEQGQRPPHRGDGLPGHRLLTLVRPRRTHPPFEGDPP